MFAIEFKMLRWGDPLDHYRLCHCDADIFVSVSGAETFLLEDLPVYELAIEANRWLHETPRKHLVWNCSDASFHPLEIIPQTNKTTFLIQANNEDGEGDEVVLGEVSEADVYAGLQSFIDAVKDTFADFPMSRKQRAFSSAV